LFELPEGEFLSATWKLIFGQDLNRGLIRIWFNSPEGEHERKARVWMFDNEIDWVNILQG